MDNKEIVVISPVSAEARNLSGQRRSVRLKGVLSRALEGLDCRLIHMVEDIEDGDLQDRRVLFAINLSSAGVNMEFYRLLEYLRAHEDCLRGSIGGIVVDGGGEMYTKGIARRMAFSANRAGCTFPGKALVEATGSLRNFQVLSRVMEKEPMEVYGIQVEKLVRRIMGFQIQGAPGAQDAPGTAEVRGVGDGQRLKVLAVHASTRSSSNTLLFWDEVKKHLEPRASIREISLRNGQMVDCRGCKYETCRHFGEKGRCFYGGIMVDQVYPAIVDCDVLVMICPNYNDALGANLTAFINRLTAVVNIRSFEKKRVYAIIVSGYSGGDILAEQVLGAMSMNKGFILPPRFALLETANDPGTVMEIPGIREKAETFADGIR
ncbi:MAG: NAD(P)H-dependent oxidoreductase [Mobilibacterium timonense]|uniref:flavodoxin family protein n=1 Tax=Mobilibacterium timonense TaxID=1871012 RepID=UPI00235457FD|nr:NAD(P)H-dependent oxidoreductase [Mobilibacterium timonense]MBM6990342.1 NAD(P)H-dependent oxidoreductase [Mobilibacterium timonense]